MQAKVAIDLALDRLFTYEVPEALTKKLAVAAKCHHERYDGAGYPSGIAGEDIPEEARIIAVADAYDAMSSDRSYRAHLSQDEIREELKKGSGGQFDPKFADIMLGIIDEDTNYSLRYKMHD